MPALLERTIYENFKKCLHFVLHFHKNKNRKRSFSNAYGCFEMVEATGVEPVS